MRAWLYDLKEMNYRWKVYFALPFAASLIFIVVVVIRHGWPDWWNLPFLLIGIPFSFFFVGMIMLFPIALIGHVVKKIFSVE